jgi:hypothetical protein
VIKFLNKRMVIYHAEMMTYKFCTGRYIVLKNPCVCKVNMVMFVSILNGPGKDS